jgi:hypothetical protein
MENILEWYKNKQSTLHEAKYTRDFLRALAKSNPSASQTLIKNGALTKGSALRNHFAKQLRKSNNGGFSGVRKLKDSIRTNDKLLSVSSPAEKKQILSNLKQQRKKLSDYRKLGAEDMNGARFVPTRASDTYNSAAQSFADKFAGGKTLTRNVTVTPDTVGNKVRKTLGMKPKSIKQTVSTRSASRLPDGFSIPDNPRTERPLSLLPIYNS